MQAAASTTTGAATACTRPQHESFHPSYDAAPPLPAEMLDSVRAIKMTTTVLAITCLSEFLGVTCFTAYTRMHWRVYAPMCAAAQGKRYPAPPRSRMQAISQPRAGCHADAVFIARKAARGDGAIQLDFRNQCCLRGHVCTAGR